MLFDPRYNPFVSIHALTRSATVCPMLWQPFLVCFNPRTHEECDPSLLRLVQQSISVSIHALTRSATCFGFVTWNVNVVSIHALTRSATSTLDDPGNYVRFQSTHSRGVRLEIVLQPIYIASFNPRTHEECDKLVLLATFFLIQFQSTHSRGVRLSTLKLCSIIKSFNPRTHEECDKSVCNK